MRYPVSEWTEAAAKKHCQDNKGTFEPAAKKKEQGMNVLTNFQDTAWGIIPERLDSMQETFNLFLKKNDHLNLSAFNEHMLTPQRSYQAKIDQGVAVIPITGVLVKRLSLITWLFGGNSTEMLGQQIKGALNDKKVNALLLDVDSPGGLVDGTEALAEIIYEGGKQKPIVTFVNGMMASAAYWAGSGAQWIVAPETAHVGSIGVLLIHYDWSRSDEMMGVKRTFLTAGNYKAMGNDAAPLEKEAREYLQKRIDAIYDIFLKGVAKNRHTDVDTVLTTMANGRLFIGQQAMDVGLIDDIGNFEKAMDKARELSQTGKNKTLNFKSKQQGGNSMTKEEFKEQLEELLSMPDMNAEAILAELGYVPKPTEPAPDIEKLKAEAVEAGKKETMDRVSGILKVCKLGGRLDMAAQMIEEGINVEAASQKVLEANAASDASQEIVSHVSGISTGETNLLVENAKERAEAAKK